jgi:hypothetical protein
MSPSCIIIVYNLLSNLTLSGAHSIFHFVGNEGFIPVGTSANLTNDLHPLPRSEMRETVHSLPHKPSWSDTNLILSMLLD